MAFTPSRLAMPHTITTLSTPMAGQKQGSSIFRVVLTGAESTGKTTLAQALAAHYDTVWAPEYLRQFVDDKGSLPVASDTPLIARGHLVQEEHYRRRARHVLFLDTDLVSTCLYHQHFFGTPPGWVLKQAGERRADLYLLMNTDIPWVSDPGQRDGPATRDIMHSLFLAAMAAVPHVVISGAFKQRFPDAVRHVDHLLGPYGRSITQRKPT